MLARMLRDNFHGRLRYTKSNKITKLRPYKIPVVHALHQPDSNKKLRFCNWVLEKINSGELDAKEFF